MPTLEGNINFFPLLIPKPGSLHVLQGSGAWGGSRVSNDIITMPKSHAAASHELYEAVLGCTANVSLLLVLYSCHWLSVDRGARTLNMRGPSQQQDCTAVLHPHPYGHLAVAAAP
jgi:hypothetical protein